MKTIIPRSPLTYEADIKNIMVLVATPALNVSYLRRHNELCDLSILQYIPSELYSMLRGRNGCVTGPR